jgi:hypothetical protein
LYNLDEHFSNPGADSGFQVRGAHLKKLRQAEGGAKIFGVFRVNSGVSIVQKLFATGGNNIVEVFESLTTSF